MKNHQPPLYIRRKDRRSGINRRWIRAPYNGEERRTGKDRRSEVKLKDLPVPQISDPKKMVGIEKLVVSTTIQLEAITRLLVEKDIVEEKELYEMIKRVQIEYQHNDPT